MDHDVMAIEIRKLKELSAKWESLGDIPTEIRELKAFRAKWEPLLEEIMKQNAEEYRRLVDEKSGPDDSMVHEDVDK